MELSYVMEPSKRFYLGNFFFSLHSLFVDKSKLHASDAQRKREYRQIPFGMSLLSNKTFLLSFNHEAGLTYAHD